MGELTVRTKRQVLDFLAGRNIKSNLRDEIKARLANVCGQRDKFPISDIDYVLEDPQLVADFMKEGDSGFQELVLA